MVGLLALAWPAAAQDGDDLGMGPISITARVQKPEVTVEITRENLDKGFELDLRESFLHKVVEAVNSAPF
jgi:hypothetical protein